MQKYTAPSDSCTLPRIITSDVYCAACLLSLGCTLDKVVKNDRRRVAFVFTGERVREFKRAFKDTEPVYVIAQSFRDALITIRRLVDQTQRSVPCPRVQQPPSSTQLPSIPEAPVLNPAEASPTVLSPV
jgi:hypothetical protein